MAVKPSCMTPSPLSVGSSSWQMIGSPEDARVLERASHHGGTRHRAAVVAERHRARSRERFRAEPTARPSAHTVTAAIGRTSQCPAASARRRTHSTHAGVSTTGSVLGMQAMVGEPARGGGACAGLDRLLAGLSRLAQVHVHVHEPRRDDGTVRVEHAGVRRRGASVPAPRRRRSTASVNALARAPVRDVPEQRERVSSGHHVGGEAMRAARGVGTAAQHRAAHGHTVRHLGEDARAQAVGHFVRQSRRRD